MAFALPGLAFSVEPQQLTPSPLRSDVAGFCGATQRGPVGEAVRVEGWRSYQRIFGGLMKDANTPYAVRGYFANGGEVAYIVRLAGDSAKIASAKWNIRDTAVPEQLAGFHQAYQIEAKTPGTWANSTRISIRYCLHGLRDQASVDITVQVADEPPEFFTDLRPATAAEEVTVRSAFIRVTPDGPVEESDEKAVPGPTSQTWAIRLKDGNNPVVTRADYLAAVEQLTDEQEIALLLAPDLYAGLRGSSDEENRVFQTEMIGILATQAGQLNDRLLVADIPPAYGTLQRTREWTQNVRNTISPAARRSIAVYHPWIRVPDPLGGTDKPLRNLPPSGNVAGIISRVDRERGAHYTPANIELFEAVDIVDSFTLPEQSSLVAEGINLLRCTTGRGLQIWGGRTLANATSDHSIDHFVAYRRLIHRLVRAIRRVAEPLVFDVNGPELWLVLVRAITSVLLESFRAGALKGERPEQGFRVRCDETTNPPEQRERGEVLCEIELAPAAPMEFIMLRVALSAEGKLEVFET